MPYLWLVAQDREINRATNWHTMTVWVFTAMNTKVSTTQQIRKFSCCVQCFTHLVSSCVPANSRRVGSGNTPSASHLMSTTSSSPSLLCVSVMLFSGTGTPRTWNVKTCNTYVAAACKYFVFRKKTSCEFFIYFLIIIIITFF